MAAKVFFVPAELKEGTQAISEKARAIFRAAHFSNCYSRNDYTAVKVHIGEHNNNTFLPTQCYKGLIDELLKLGTKPFATDTSTLYVGRRHNGIDHSILAFERGYNPDVLGIPFIIPDGIFGTSEAPIDIEGSINKQVFVAYDIARCQSILSLAHFTGHIATGAAATIKTLGMGCTSRKAKMRQHSSIKPQVLDACTLCGECRKHCPADAISYGDIIAHIDRDKCIGCAECVAVCRFNAIAFDFASDTLQLQKNIAEHALGVLQGKSSKAVFFVFAMSITADCDCLNRPNTPIISKDIGILASTDPVAVDVAALDLLEAQNEKKLTQLLKNDKLYPRCQFEHAELIGLGTANYELVKIDV